MALIKSISGIRGTIGGKPGESLSPVDIVKFASAFGTWVLSGSEKQNPVVVIGRDARKSGPMVNILISTSLRSLGISVTDLGLASTPTVEMAVTGMNADGGIIITASHNPAEWNALKLLGKSGEFLSSAEGEKVLDIAEKEDFMYVADEKTGTLSVDDSWGRKHIEKILELENVDAESVKAAGYRIAIDCVNSVGGLIVPELLRALGVETINGINTKPDGNFAHNPEPLPENLGDLSRLVVSTGSDLGFVVDPDVDRLAIICEDGSMFGEEYTLVAVADYVLNTMKGSTVSNLSSTRALRDIAERHGCTHFSAPVGEVNVVEEMKRREAVIGGEGNGGVIFPELHYGRDALAGIALFLTHLSKKKMKCSELRKLYPDYHIAKKKLRLDPTADFRRITAAVKEKFAENTIDERDGLWIGHPEGWVQIRKSNTEPIMRIYAEAPTPEEAGNLADAVIEIVKNL
jgi:phosphomannomutase